MSETWSDGADLLPASLIFSPFPRFLDKTTLLD